MLVVAAGIRVLSHRSRPIFGRSEAAGGRAFEAQRSVRASPAGDFDLPASNDAVAARAEALVIERLPLAAWVQLAEGVELIFNREPQGGERCHAKKRLKCGRAAQLENW